MDFLVPVVRDLVVLLELEYSSSSNSMSDGSTEGYNIIEKILTIIHIPNTSCLQPQEQATQHYAIYIIMYMYHNSDTLH